MHYVNPDDLLANLGRRIAEIRAERRLTQEDLADKACVTPRYIQSVEAGEENLTLRTIAKFARILAVPVIDLFQPPTQRKRGPGRPRRCDHVGAMHLETRAAVNYRRPEGDQRRTL